MTESDSSIQKGMGAIPKKHQVPPLKDAVVFEVVRTKNMVDENGGDTSFLDSWHVRLVANNGNKVFWTEGYTQRHSAVEAAMWLVNLFGYEGDYQIRNVDERESL